MVHRMVLTIFSLCPSVCMGPLLNQQLGISLFIVTIVLSLLLFLNFSSQFPKHQPNSTLNQIFKQPCPYAKLSSVSWHHLMIERRET